MNGRISLARLFDEPDYDIDGITSDASIETLVYAACRGGWPVTVNIGREKSRLLIARSYVDTVCREDVSRIDGVRRDERVARMILRTYARNICTVAKNTSLLEDVISSGEVSLTMPTFDDYVSVLKNLFVIDNIEAWCPAVRSRTAIRRGVKRAFTDPSIAAAALGAGPEDMVNDLNTMGLMFETLCMRDLRTYSQALGGEVYHYRDSNGLECDAVVHLRNGSYGLIEIKLGGDTLISEGVRTLEAMAKVLDTSRMKAPSFRMVLTATGKYAYSIENGVCIVPVSCLKD